MERITLDDKAVVAWNVGKRTAPSGYKRRHAIHRPTARGLNWNLTDYVQGSFPPASWEIAWPILSASLVCYHPPPKSRPVSKNCCSSSRPTLFILHTVKINTSLKFVATDSSSHHSLSNDDLTVFSLTADALWINMCTGLTRKNIVSSDNLTFKTSLGT